MNFNKKDFSRLQEYEVGIHVLGDDAIYLVVGVGYVTSQNPHFKWQSPRHR
jgi:hypothetical protein